MHKAAKTHISVTWNGHWKLQTCVSVSIKRLKRAHLIPVFAFGSTLFLFLSIFRVLHVIQDHDLFVLGIMMWTDMQLFSLWFQQKSL